MDVQNAIVPMIKEADPGYTGRVAEAVAAARINNIPVIFVVVGFRKGYPEVSMENKGFSALKGSNRGMDTEAAMTVDSAVQPLEGEPVVVKKRVSAFAGSDLELILRSGGIRHLVLTGLATSGVVLSTLREAADKDYRLTVLADGCGDMDEEVHRVLTSKVFPRQADVLSCREWIDTLRG